MKRIFLTLILAAMAATAMAQEGDGQSSLTSEASISGQSIRTGESARSGEREISEGGVSGEDAIESESRLGGIDFQFSGHTHNGQIWPATIVTSLVYENSYGYCEKEGTRYYVSSGLGIWGGKFRIGTRSEYVVLNLRPE